MSLTYQFESALDRSGAPRHVRALRHPLRTAVAKCAAVAARYPCPSIPAYTTVFWGQRLVIRLPEPISTRLVRDGFHEPPLTRLLLDTLRPGDVFFDVGAHYGYFTCLAAELVGTSGQVHAFEPVPGTFAVLRRNTRAYRQVRLSGEAAWSTRGTVSIPDLGHRWSSHNSVYRPRGPVRATGREHVHDVPAVPLDDYCERWSLAPTLLKIDAESAEHAILIGAQAILRRHQPLVVLEVGDFGVPGTPTSAELVLWMRSQGYTVSEFGAEGSVTQHELQERYEYGNLLFSPC